MKLGVLVNNLGPNQLAYNIIKNFNIVKDIDTIVFYENFVKPCFSLNFSSMQLYEAWSYDGPIISTKLSNASKLIKFPACNNKFFYVWDLEWTRFTNKYYRQLQSVYANPELKIIARSPSHKKIIENCWNVKVIGIVDDFDLKTMLEVINGT